VGPGAPGQDAGPDLAAFLSAALHPPGGHVVDDPAATHGSAPGLVDFDVAGEDHGLGLQVVVYVVRGGVDRTAPVEVLLQAHRGSGQDHLLDVAATAADVGPGGTDVQRALHDPHVPGEHAWAAVIAHRAVVAVGGEVHRLVAVAGLRPGGRQGDGRGQGQERREASGAWGHSGCGPRM